MLKNSVTSHGTCQVDAASPRQVVFDDGYLARLRSGDSETARHFNTHFRRLVRAKVWQKFDRQGEEDFVDEVMTVAIEKIIKGQPKDASFLPGYIYGICSNLMKVRFRRRLFVVNLDDSAAQFCDRERNVEARLLDAERAASVRQVLKTLGRRDREVLAGLFIDEEDRDEICAKQGMSREQLRLVLLRARRRFQNEWEKRGKASTPVSRKKRVKTTEQFVIDLGVLT